VTEERKVEFCKEVMSDLPKKKVGVEGTLVSPYGGG